MQASCCRKFPSLVNCCSIDWFSEWPEDALKSVASKFLSAIEMKSEATRVAVEDMCMSFHQSVRRLAVDFHRKLQRHYYATPTSYLELIHTYKDLLGKKQKDIQNIKCRWGPAPSPWLLEDVPLESIVLCRYEIGLQKLLSAETDVNAMKTDLIELQPKLIETGKEVEKTLEVVNTETAEAETKRKIVQGEEAVANEKAAAAKLIKARIKGTPALQSCGSYLKTTVVPAQFCRFCGFRISTHRTSVKPSWPWPCRC